MRFVYGTCLALLALAIVNGANAQKGYSTNAQPIYPSGISSKVQLKLLADDLSHNGKPAVFAYGDAPNSDSVLFLNDGKGLLTAAEGLIPYTGGNRYVQTGDLNGDGAIDLAVCSVDGSTAQQSTITTLINDGKGRFSVGSSIPLPFVCTSVNLLDRIHFDTRDELKDDVMVTGYTGTGPYNNMIAYLDGDTTGKLGSPGTIENIMLDSASSPMTTNCALIDATQGRFYGDLNGGRHYSDHFIFNTACSPASGPANHYGTTFVYGAYPQPEVRAGEGILRSGKIVRTYYDDEVFISTDGSGTPKLVYARYDTKDCCYNYGRYTFLDITSALPLSASITQIAGVTPLPRSNGLAVAYMTGTPDSGKAYVSILYPDGHGIYSESQHWLVGDATTTLLGDITSTDLNGDGLDDIVATYQNPVNGDVFLLEYLDTPGSDSCAVPETPGTSIICSPASGTTVDGTVKYTTASNLPGFTEVHFLLDGHEISRSLTQSNVGTTVTSGGTHTLTMVSYNNTGGSITTSSEFNVPGGGTNSPCSQTTPGVRICAPLTSSVDSALTLTASALAASGNISAIRVYSDSVAIGTFYNPAPASSFYINQSILIEPGPHTLTLVAYETTGGYSTADVSVVVAGQKGCAVAPVPLSICGLGADVTVPGTFVIGAGATSLTAGITGIRAYIDDQEAFFVPSSYNAPAFETQREVSAGPGRHHLVVVAYQGTEPAITRDQYFNVADTTAQPCYPSAAGATICSPSADATGSSPVQIVAGATVTDGYLTAVRVYIDDVEQLTTYNPHQSKSFQINQPLTIAAGVHSVAVVGYSSNGTAVTASESVTLQ